MSKFTPPPPPEIIAAVDKVGAWLIANDATEKNIFGIEFEKPDEKEIKPGTTHGCRLDHIEADLKKMRTTMKLMAENMKLGFLPHRKEPAPDNVGKPFTKVDSFEMGDKVAVSGLEGDKEKFNGEYEVTANYGRVDELREQNAELLAENAKLKLRLDNSAGDPHYQAMMQERFNEIFADNLNLLEDNAKMREVLEEIVASIWQDKVQYGEFVWACVDPATLDKARELLKGDGG